MNNNEITADFYRQINTADAAKFLSITRRKLEQMRQHGNGPAFVRVTPKCVRYRIIDLVAFQEENLKRSTLYGENIVTT